jgi:hypothetical protein
VFEDIRIMLGRGYIRKDGSLDPNRTKGISVYILFLALSERWETQNRWIANITETRRHHMCLLDNGLQRGPGTSPDTDEAVAQIEDLMGGMNKIVVGE